MTGLRLTLLLTALLAAGCTAGNAPTIRVGSLRDVEGNLLGELFAQVLEATGEARVERRLGLGGPGVAFASFSAGEVDLMPSYSGSLADLLLKQPALTDFATMQRLVEAQGYAVSPPLGFNNTYGIGVRRSVATQYGLKTIGDLRGKPWRGAVTPEFAQSPNGLGPMAVAYGLELPPARTMEHALAYVALARGEVDFVDVYTTDATIRQQDLVVLEDDRRFFVRYDGLVLARAGFARDFPRSWAALTALAGRLADSTMTRLNAEFEIDRVPAGEVAARWLGRATPGPGGRSRPDWVRLTIEHLALVGVSLAIAMLIGLPLGVWTSRRPALARAVLAVVGVVQTIPGIALLCFFIPFAGVGWRPAVYALALYALLPIVQGVITGLQQVDPTLRDVAAVLGMTRVERRRRVEWPIAAPAVVAGIRVAAVINVGTAAMAAMIGAGGYGTRIMTGLALNDWRVVMEGALPSALLAVLIHQGLAAVEHRVARWQHR